jgi:hypothetical protein
MDDKNTLYCCSHYNDWPLFLMGTDIIESHFIFCRTTFFNPFVVKISLP